jgi:plastocyanin
VLPTRVIAVAAVAVLAVAGCGSDDDDRSPGPNDLRGYDATPDAVITVDERGFRPAEVRVPTGGLVLVRNKGDEPHAVADLDEIDTGELQPGDEITIALDEPGRFTYHDALAPEHEGVVVVRAERR